MSPGLGAWDGKGLIGITSPCLCSSLLRERRMGWVGLGQRKLPLRYRPWLKLRSRPMLRHAPDLPRWPRPSPQVLLAALPPFLTHHVALGYGHQFSGLPLPGDSTLHRAWHTAGACQSFLNTAVRYSMDGGGAGESGSKNGALLMGRLQP